MIRSLLIVAVLLAACGGDAAPAFDVAHVQSNFRDECRDPIVVDDLFCEQVRLDSISADGSKLIVPTTLRLLDDASRDRAIAICDALRIARFDIDGEPLGYRFIEVQATDGGYLRSCSVSQ